MFPFGLSQIWAVEFCRPSWTLHITVPETLCSQAEVPLSSGFISSFPSPGLKHPVSFPKHLSLISMARAMRKRKCMKDTCSSFPHSLPSFLALRSALTDFLVLYLACFPVINLVNFDCFMFLGSYLFCVTQRDGKSDTNIYFEIQSQWKRGKEKEEEV